jgi:hypothetical protein
MPITTRSPRVAVNEMNAAFDKTMSKSPGWRSMLSGIVGHGL